MHFRLVTERPMKGDSRVCREELLLRSREDATIIREALRSGTLVTNPGVHAYVHEAFGPTAALDS